MINALPLDGGEKSAIQLAINTDADWILLDMLARQEAKSLGLKVILFTCLRIIIKILHILYFFLNSSYMVCSLR